MPWDKLKESGAVDNPDNPSTNDWIGDIDTDFIGLKIDEYEKAQSETLKGGFAPKEFAAIEKLFDRYSEADIESLDENTIDTDFVPKARDVDGTTSSKDNHDPWHKYSPFASQQDSDGALISEGFKAGKIENGTILYQLGKEDSSGEWFTDSATVDSCRDPNTGSVDIAKLKEKLQIKDTGLFIEIRFSTAKSFIV